MIELERITKTYADGLEALKGVSLRLDEGMFGLLGHNGAGKTTLLSILVLGLEPTSLVPLDPPPDRLVAGPGPEPLHGLPGA